MQTPLLSHGTHGIGLLPSLERHHLLEINSYKNFINGLWLKRLKNFKLSTAWTTVSISGITTVYVAVELWLNFLLQCTLGFVGPVSTDISSNLFFIQYKFSLYVSCSLSCVFSCHVVFALDQNSRASRRHRSTSHRSRKKMPERDIWKSCIVWVWQSKNTSMFQVVVLWVEGNDSFPIHFIPTLRNISMTCFSLAAFKGKQV